MPWLLSRVAMDDQLTPILGVPGLPNFSIAPANLPPSPVNVAGVDMVNSGGGIAGNINLNTNGVLSWTVGVNVKFADTMWHVDEPVDPFLNNDLEGRFIVENVITSPEGVGGVSAIGGSGTWRSLRFNGAGITVNTGGGQISIDGTGISEIRRISDQFLLGRFRWRARWTNV